MPSYLNLFTAFDGYRHLITGALADVALGVKRAAEDGVTGPVTIIDNATGRSMDIKTMGSEEEMLAGISDLAELAKCSESDQKGGGKLEKPKGRGRPKLGVVAREVTLLPRHWAWLADQPGGASVALRKLVEQARKESTTKDRVRAANERAYHFMSAIAGDLPGFEEAIRALFAGEQEKFTTQISSWPDDIRNHASWLAFGRVRLHNG